MANGKISVIIPVYNTGNHLYKCLDSITNQTYKNLEIIIIDDGSTDESPKICDDYASKDSRIKVIHKANEGVSKARNTGIELATGDYFYFPDSDDYIEPDSFKYLLYLIGKHNCDIVSFEYYVTIDGRDLVHKSKKETYGLFDSTGAHRAVAYGTPFAWNRFFTRKAVDGIKYREYIFRGEDSLFVHECIENIDLMCFNDRPLYHYVQSKESACRGKFRPAQLSGIKLFDEYKLLYKDKYPELWIHFIGSMLNLPITLYYDMYADDEDYSDDMKKLHRFFREKYDENISICHLSFKEKVKYKMFYLAPNLFCKVHKLIHKL